ncbi:MAG TPA: hypothetical protein VIL48_08735 [Acidimicrobiales bacterium]
MRRAAMVAASVGLAAGVSLGFAGVSGAQSDGLDPIPGTMEIRPEIVAPGGDVTARSISPCHPEGTVEWELTQVVGGGEASPVAGTARADAEGHWAVDVAVPDDQGRYRFDATCTLGDSAPYIYTAELRAQWEHSSSEPPDLPTEPEPEPDPDPEPEPEAPEPATPVPGEPDFAG